MRTIRDRISLYPSIVDSHGGSSDEQEWLGLESRTQNFCDMIAKSLLRSIGVVSSLARVIEFSELSKGAPSLKNSVLQLPRSSSQRPSNLVALSCPQVYEHHAPPLASLPAIRRLLCKSILLAFIVIGFSTRAAER